MCVCVGVGLSEGQGEVSGDRNIKTQSVGEYNIMRKPP